MDNRQLRKHLKQVEEHIALGEKTLARQRKVVAELELLGLDASQAKELLTTFENIQAQSIAERDELRGRLRPDNST